jgi:hypothetical protein
VFARCVLVGRGVDSVELDTEYVLPNRAAAILKKLSIEGWKEQDGSFVSHYAGFTGYVWEEEDGRWGYQAERTEWSSPAGYARNVSEAKRSVAAQIAER